MYVVCGSLDFFTSIPLVYQKLKDMPTAMMSVSQPSPSTSVYTKCNLVFPPMLNEVPIPKVGAV